MAAISVKNLSFTYSGSAVPALTDIDFEVAQGEFVVIAGRSGCGKSTLLRLLKKQLAPKGEKHGGIYFGEKEAEELSDFEAAFDIGFVMQSPDNQIVTDKVWHELAFALESRGEDGDAICRKVAEVCGFFGIGQWYHSSTADLSGGQKQLLNLAAVMVTQPKILLLDEPTSQLDPIAAAEFIAEIKRISVEIGTTVLLVEHRLEEVFPIADKVLLLGDGGVKLFDTPKNVGKKMREYPDLFSLPALPTAVKIYLATGAEGECPLTVREGRDFLSARFKNTVKSLDEASASRPAAAPSLQVKEGYFRYERDGQDVLRGFTASFYPGEFLCLLGANGAGKTTLLKILSGLLRLQSGSVRVLGSKIQSYKGGSLYRENVAYLSQNPQLVFSCDTVFEDLLSAASVIESTKEQAEQSVREVTEKLGISKILSKHPYDISGGEQQKAAIAKLLLTHPKIVLLDEPTKAIDADSKIVLAEILKSLAAEGKTVIAVTHDVEFAAMYADRCGMFFDGQLVSEKPPALFFSENSFYTTAASRISRHMYDRAVTARQVIELCQKNK